MVGSLVSLFVPGSSGFLVAESRGTERLCAVDQAWKEQYSRIDPQALKKMRPAGDFTRCVFQVRQQHQYSAHKRLSHHVTADSRIPHSLASNCEHERRLNELEFEAACGTALKYGDIIQLAQPIGRGYLHPLADSQEFITIQRRAAQLNEECGRVVVSSTAGEDAWLRVMPALRTHSTGDRLRVHKFGELVMATDPILLEGVSYAAARLPPSRGRRTTSRYRYIAVT